MNENNLEIEYDTKNPRYFAAGVILGALLGTLLGTLAGAAAMLLMAPQSGQKTRKQIRRKGRDMRNQTVETLEGGVRQVRNKAQHVSTGIHDQAEDMQQRGQELVDNQKERWTPVVEAGKAAVNGS